MMTITWDRNCLARAVKRTANVLLFSIGLFAAPTPAPNLESLSRAYVKAPTAASEAGLLRYASTNPKTENGGLALLLVGANKADAGDPAAAVKHLDEAKDRLPKLKDYASYYMGRAYYRSQDYAKAVDALESVVRSSPASPLRPRAILLIATIRRETNAPKQAVSLLRKYADELPQPDGLELLALCQEDTGDNEAAVSSWQTVYTDYPALPVAKRASAAFARLRARMGASYPPLMPDDMFKREDRLIAAGEFETARRELQDMTVKLAGEARDRARVWLGRLRYTRRQDAIAYKWLNTLKVTSPEVEAERLYYLLMVARRLERSSEMLNALERLNHKRYKTSPWRLQALVNVGNYYLLRNEPAKYEPLYRDCIETFPFEKEASYCHWKVSWTAYLQRSAKASTLMRQHVQLFPDSQNVPSALYFLGRLSEREGQMESARAYYERLASRFPNYYYATLATERMQEKTIAGVKPSSFVRQFLNELKLSETRAPESFVPSDVTRLRLAKARLLLSAGRDDWAEGELRYGARKGEQAPVLAMELSRLAASRGDYGKSIRYIKGLAPGYLSIPIEGAPDEFWRLAYPLRFREQLERYSKQRDLDPYFMAALIRQESEFDVDATSRVSARGLTQIMPATGRTLSRKLGYRRFKTSMLHKADVNINMGSYYFRTLVEELDGHVEAALASYNAGMSRARAWLTWADYREPAEFVETIPFSETRNYVQIVLRNAYIYRRVYAGPVADSDSPGKKTPVADARRDDQ